MTLATDASTPGYGRRPAAVEACGLEELRGFEKRLEADWSALGAKGYTFGGVRTCLADPDLSEEQRRHHLEAAQHAQSRFLHDLNEFQRLQHVHFMERVVRELDHAVTMMDAFYGQRIRWIHRRHRRLKRLAARYHALEHLYGTARDHQRIEVYQRFYAGVLAFSDRVRRLDPTLPRPAPGTLVDAAYRVRRGLIWFLMHVGTLVHLGVAFARILRTALSAKPGGDGTPFTRQVDDLFGTYGRLKGYEVVISGHENVPRVTGKSTVNLFTPAHRHGVTDNVTFSHLGLSDYLVFNAVDQLPLLPHFLKDRIARTDGLIPVGKARGSSVDRALEVLGRGASHNLLIYPEGTVSEGFRGTRPPRPNFGAVLVPRLREAGYELNLVPVTYLDNARFLDQPPRSAAPEEHRLRVVVSPGLDTPMIDALLASGGGEMVNRMVRLAWLESLVTDEHHFLGQDRVRGVERRLDFALDGLRYWGSLEPAPVRDTLVTIPPTPIEVHEEPFRGKRVRVFYVPERAQIRRRRIVFENLRAPDSHELLIGIRPPAHIYLNVGRRRFDGDIFRQLSIKDREYCYPGIVIRFVDVPIKSLNAIRRRLEEFGGREQRTLTCANSACQVIARAANIKIDDHADMRPFLPSHVLPTRTMRKIIERGVRSHSGDPVEYQIYNTDGRRLEVVLADMRREEIRIAKDHLRMLTSGAYRSFVAWSGRRFATVCAAKERLRARRGKALPERGADPEQGP